MAALLRPFEIEEGLNQTNETRPNKSTVQIHCEVLVFSTNVSNAFQAGTVCKALLKNRDVYEVSIDVKDLENILRIECTPIISAQKIEGEIVKLGFCCTELKSRLIQEITTSKIADSKKNCPALNKRPGDLRAARITPLFS